MTLTLPSMASRLAATAALASLVVACGGDESGRSGSPSTGGSSQGGNGSGTAGVAGDPSVPPPAGSGPVGSGGTPSNGDRPPFDAGSDPNRNKVQPGGLCDRLSTIQCAGEVHCCEAPGRAFEQCKQEMQQLCADELFLDSMASDPITAFDAAHAERAFDQLEQLASSCDPTVAAWGSSLDGLRGMLRGTRPAGADCTPPPTFSAAQAAAALASCADAATTACLTAPLLEPWTCAPRGGPGAPCFTDINCVDGLYCDNPSLAVTGAQCAQRKADGAGCQTPNECASLMCKRGQCVPADVQAAYCLRND